jgi:hypothetical protein
MTQTHGGARTVQIQPPQWFAKPTPLSAVLLDLSMVPSLDISATLALQEMLAQWESTGAAVALVVAGQDSAGSRGSGGKYLHEYRRRRRGDVVDAADAAREIEEGTDRVEIAAAIEIPEDVLENTPESPMALSKVPAVLLPSLMPKKWRTAAATVAALRSARPTKSLQALELGGVLESIGEYSVFYSISEALVALHQRGVIPDPPSTSIRYDITQSSDWSLD